MRLRRSLLFVPGSAPEAIAAAAASAADGVILDLEDTVLGDHKLEARQWVVAALRRVDFGGRERVVRINALAGPFGREDVAAVIPAAPQALMLPKVAGPHDVTEADGLVRGLEHDAGLAPGAIRFHLLIETAAAVLAAPAIASCSARVTALVFGASDLARETRARLVPSRTPELYALSRVLLAARTAGLDALDSPYLEVDDRAGLEAHLRIAADLGYDGATVIHPDQIPVVNRVFTPGPDAVAEARRVVDAYEAAARAGGGAVTLAGRFIDRVHVETARETLARARRAGAA